MCGTRSRTILFQMSGFSSLAEMQAIILGRHIWGISKFLRFINELAEEREMVSEMSHCCRLGGLGKDCGGGLNGDVDLGRKPPK